jgi:ribonuclease HI
MIIIYTDGSCLTNPGNGGWAAIINQDGKIKKITGSEKNTTNNRMELLAPINALKQIDTKSKIEIFTDSQYVKLGITEWINKWVNNNWQTAKKEDVKNKDLWVELYNLNQSLDVNWNWVKAHAGNPLNEEVDSLAKQAANLD